MNQSNSTPLQSAIIPKSILETLDWLLKVEEFESVRELSNSLGKYLPGNLPDATDFRASVLYKSRHFRQATELALKTVELLPQSPDAKFNAAKCLSASGNPHGAEAMIQKALELRPIWPDAELELAVYTGLQGRHDEAMLLLEGLGKRVPAESPNGKVINYNLGWHDIRKGRFQSGMRRLASGRALGIWGTRMKNAVRCPLLHSHAELKDKTVLIIGEAGAGDEIIAMRFGRILANLKARVIWAPQASLRGIARRVEGIHEVVTQEEALNISADYWAPAMDLPFLMELGIEDLSPDPYLAVDPVFKDKWSDIIPKKPGRLRVGIRWQGNHLYEQDLLRSVPFQLLENLSDIPGVDLYSLQRDEGIEEIQKDSRVVNLANELKTWEDTLAAIAELDLVISSCTAIAHFSAALGKPTWVLCPLNSYYVWSTPGDTSPWYQSVRLFRQEQLHSWATPISKLEMELRRLAHEAPMRSFPSSP